MDEQQLLELKNINENNLKKFIFSNIITYAKVYKIYDGDSVSIIFKYKDEFIKYSCRIANIDTPEIRTKDIKEKEYAYKARDYLRSLILNKIIKVELLKFDKYGRLLINIFFENNKNISDIMIKEGYAVQYSGGKKKSWNFN